MKGIERNISALLTAIQLSSQNSHNSHSREDKMRLVPELVRLARRELDYGLYYDFLHASAALSTYPDLLDETKEEMEEYAKTEEGKEFIETFKKILNGQPSSTNFCKIR